MSPLGKITRWLKRSPHLTARYDAAWNSVNRTHIPAVVTSARIDMGSAPRLEIIRKVRYFEKNNPLVQKILDLIETNVVGTGINPTPVSADQRWNTEALAWWNQWCGVCDVTSRQNFYALQGIIARALAVDGEIFIYLTQGENGLPRVQLIESHRVVDAALRNAITAPDLRLHDGILIDARGRPQRYLIADEFDGNTIAAIPADDILHVFEPSRACQYRGISLFHSVVNTLHDLDDIQRFEMIAAKDAAATSKVVKTRTGEVKKSDLFSDPASALAGRSQFYRQTLGGETIVIEHGDEYAQFQSDRPTVTTQHFWEYLTDLVCKGVGISFAAMQDYRGQWGGAALRGAVVSDNRFYEIRTRTLATHLDRIWRHVIGTAIANGQLKNPPQDWTRVAWQPPRRASVDIGRESRAVIDELGAGLRTMRDTLGEYGLDWRDVMRQRAEEVALQTSLEQEYELRPGSLCTLSPQAMQQQQAAAQAQPSPGGEPAKPEAGAPSPR